MFPLIYNNFFIKLVAFFSVLMGLYILFPFQIVSADGHSLNDTNSGLSYLFAVFFVIWIFFFGYTFFLTRRIKEMKKEVDFLKEELDKKE
tara:strand:+ start:657 stop:926 length:270 start_codon:yes stop_codon:yes gene_type:complete